MRAGMLGNLRCWHLVTIGMLALANSGCLVAAAGAAAGAGGAAVYAHHLGADSNTFEADLNTVWRDSEDALYDLGMPVTKELHNNGASGTIKSTTGTGDSVTIEVEPETSKIPNDPVRTKVTVRVGTFGDHEVGMRVLNRIEQRFASNRGTAAPVAGAAGRIEPTVIGPTTPGGTPATPAAQNKIQIAPVAPAVGTPPAANGNQVAPAVGTPPVTSGTPVAPASATNWQPAPNQVPPAK